MPAKLKRCVSKVKKQGKDESSAYAICSASTGIKKCKGGGWKKGKKTVKESIKINLEQTIHLPLFDQLVKRVCK